MLLPHDQVIKPLCRLIQACHGASLLCELGIFIVTVTEIKNSSSSDHGMRQSAFLVLSFACTLASFVLNIIGARTLWTALKRLGSRLPVSSAPSRALSASAAGAAPTRSSKVVPMPAHTESGQIKAHDSGSSQPVRINRLVGSALLQRL